MYRNTHQQFNRRHVFHLEAVECLGDEWIHKVSGDGVDAGMNFRFYWLPIDEAEVQLSASMGSSIRKLTKSSESTVCAPS